MAINLNQTTSDQVVESASELDAKGRFRVVMALLPTLNSWQLEELLTVGDQVLADVLLQEDEGYAKFEYKEISKNFYAYVRDWGETQCNLYIGPMRFMPGMKYQLTHKSKKTVKTLVGLGLYRDREQIYLKIQHLTPVEEIQSYLFYDKTQRFPRRPQEDSIYTLFSKKDWKIECLGSVEARKQPAKTVISVPALPGSLDGNRIQKNTISSVIQSVATRVETPGVTKYTDIAGQPSKEGSSRPTDSRVVQGCPASHRKNIGGEASRKQQLVVQVKRNFISQVGTYMEQWATLSQSLPNNPQWELVPHANGVALRNEAAEIIVEYNSSSQTVTAPSARILLSWLEQITFSVANSPLVNQERKSVATRWLQRLQSAPRQDGNKLLNYLFNL